MRKNLLFQIFVLCIITANMYSCNKTTSPYVKENTSPSFSSANNEIEDISVTNPITLETEESIKKVNATKQALAQITTNESDYFAKSFRNGNFVDDDKGGLYYQKILERNSFFPTLCYDMGHEEIVNTGFPESGCFLYDIISLKGALYGILHQDLTDDYFIIKYLNGDCEKLLDVPVDNWYFAEEGIYYQIDNSIYIIDYNGVESTFISKIPDELYVDSHYCRFVVYRDYIWYQHWSYYDNINTPLWCYNLESGVFKQIYTGIHQANLVAINNGYLYFLSKNGVFRFNVVTYEMEMVSDLRIRPINFFADNILFISEKNDVYKINSCGSTKIIDGNCKKFDYDEPYYHAISVHNDELFIDVQFGEDYGKVVKIDLFGNDLGQVFSY